MSGALPGNPTPTPDWEALYLRLGQLVASMPELRGRGTLSSDALKWPGRADVLVWQVCGPGIELNEFRAASSLLSSLADMRDGPAGTIAMIVHRALARAEERAPVAVRGSFIPAGGAFDAFAVIGKILGTATTDILIVDPYMDETTLTDFAPTAPAGVPLRLLTDQQAVKPSLRPAVQRWATQYGAQRPLTARLAAPRTLHDRLIVIDRQTAWLLTQSLNAFAARSPGSIEKTNPEAAALKIPAYEAIWTSAAPL